MPFSSASEIRTYDLTTIEDNALTTEPTPVPDPNPKSNIHITKNTFLVRYDYGVENYNCYMFTRLLAGCYINKLIKVIIKSLKNIKCNSKYLSLRSMFCERCNGNQEKKSFGCSHLPPPHHKTFPTKPNELNFYQLCKQLVSALKSGNGTR